MRKCNLALLCVLFALMGGCATQHRVYPVSEKSPTSEQGIVYALPKTVLRIEIPVIQTTTVKGSLADCAKACLGTDDAIMAKEITYRIGDPILSYSSRADEDHVYMVAVKGGPFENRDIELELSSKGLLTSAVSSVEDKSIDIAIQTVKTAASVASVFISGGAAASSVAGVSKSLSTSSYLNGYLYRPQIVERFAEPQKSPCASCDPRAEEVLQALVDLRESRRKLITGGSDAEISKEALETMLKAIDVEEGKLVAEFMGTKTEKIWSAYFEIAPKDWKESHKLLAYGTKTGVSVEKKHALNTEPAAFSGSGHTTSVVLSIETDDYQMAATVEKGYKPKPGVKGYYYRVPGSGTIRVHYGDQLKLTETKPIAQYGTIAALPVSTGSLRKSTYTLSLDPESGALTKLKASSQALDPATIAQAGEAAKAWAEVYQAQQAAKAAERQAEQQRREEIINRLLEQDSTTE